MRIVQEGVSRRDIIESYAKWERIVRGKFDANGIYRTRRTVAAIAPHPVARGLSNEYWVGLGRLLLNNVRNATATRANDTTVTIRD